MLLLQQSISITWAMAQQWVKAISNKPIMLEKIEGKAI
jgi:hypothetical protein